MFRYEVQLETGTTGIVFTAFDLEIGERVCACFFTGTSINPVDSEVGILTNIVSKEQWRNGDLHGEAAA
jgi:hypothetical protein